VSDENAVREALRRLHARDGWVHSLENEMRADAFAALDRLVARLRQTEEELREERGRLALREAAMRHVIHYSPGTPDSVKKYLLRELEGSWGDPYEQTMLASAEDGPVHG
jgi:hypothetical protein